MSDKKRMLDNLKYRLENQMKEVDSDWILDSLVTIKSQNKHIRSKLVNKSKPRYNSYVKSLTADLLIWMGSVEEILDILVFNEYKKEKPD